MIEVHNLIYEYPNHRALDDISFRINKGSITALIGPNGAGKTTLLKCLAALAKPFSGNISINGIDSSEKPRECHKYIGYLPDFFGLYDNLTVHQALNYFALAYNVDKSQIENRIIAVAENLDLMDKLHEDIMSLSRGMRQRLAIGQAIIHNPLLLLLDEPASGLDPEARYSLSQLFIKLNQQGMTILVSSHILAELDEYAGEMLILRDGKIIEKKVDANEKTFGRQFVITVIQNPLALKEMLDKSETIKNIIIENNQLKFDFFGNDTEQHDLLTQLMNSGIQVMEFYTKQTNIQEHYLKSIKNK